MSAEKLSLRLKPVSSTEIKADYWSKILLEQMLADGRLTMGRYWEITNAKFGKYLEQAGLAGDLIQAAVAIEKLPLDKQTQKRLPSLQNSYKFLCICIKKCSNLRGIYICTDLDHLSGEKHQVGNIASFSTKNLLISPN